MELCWRAILAQLMGFMWSRGGLPAVLGGSRCGLGSSFVPPLFGFISTNMIHQTCTKSNLEVRRLGIAPSFRVCRTTRLATSAGSRWTIIFALYREAKALNLANDASATVSRIRHDHH
jgi:hypothetical protein